MRSTRSRKRWLATGVGSTLALVAALAWADEPAQVTGVKAWLNVEQPDGARGPVWDRDGAGRIDFAPIRTGVVVLEFWATWCPPCRESIPHLNELHRRRAGEVTVIGLTAIDRHQDERAIRAFVAENVRYPVGIIQGGETYERYSVDGIPHAVVIGRDGQVAWTGNPLSEEFEQAVERAVRAGAQPASRPSRR